jgi:hypothetical protein
MQGVFPRKCGLKISNLCGTGRPGVKDESPDAGPFSFVGKGKKTIESAWLDSFHGAIEPMGSGVTERKTAPTCSDRCRLITPQHKTNVWIDDVRV